MAITVQGLSFHPLFWMYNDCWKYLVRSGTSAKEWEHWGHVHFFMLGYNWSRDTADAFSGSQNFHFEIQDVWGPRSTDPNQQFQYTVIGLPKWYFHVTEVWRRVYIQNWDESVNIPGTNIVGRRGVKYDASQPLQTFGPFREGQGAAPIFIHSARTLPLEYYTTELKDRTKRDNYVKQKYQSAGDASGIPFGDGTLFDPPPNGTEPYAGDPGGHATWADGLYIYPIIEYQQVTQLNWERLPGYAEKNDIDADHFGDGWALDVSIPFTDPTTNKYRSPFGPTPGVCMPFGQYFNDLVSVENIPLYRVADNRPADPTAVPPFPGGYDWQNRPFGLPDALSQTPVQFQNPYGVSDGKWVQQCLGGIVQAQAVVTIESKLGGRQDITINSVQYLPQDNFAGTDQNQGTA